MASLPKYQIFISSTYEDLRSERDQVIKAVLEMGHIPVGMEMFSAADEEQWKIIARYIDESDYYVAIVAHRYGSTTPENISYTRKEYEYARAQGIPCLGFVIDSGVSWPPDNIDTVHKQKKALDDFKALIQEKPVSFWKSAEDLHSKVSIALMKSMNTTPRDGWVRASSVGGPEVTSELIRLSAENADLRARLSVAQAEAAKERNDEISQTIRSLFDSKLSPSYRYTPNGRWVADVEVSLFEVFLNIAQSMMVEESVSGLASSLAMNIRADKDKSSWDIVALNQMQGILADFLTLELVEPSTRKHAVADTNEYWTLTPVGIEVLKRIRKVSLNNALPEAEDSTDSVNSTASNDSSNSADIDSPKSGDPV